MNETEIKLLLRHDLQMFAKDGPGGEKTEPATAKKRSDTRKEGQVAKSKDLCNAILLLVFFLVIRLFISYVHDGFTECFTMIYTKMADFGDNNNLDFSIGMMHYTIREVLIKILLILLPFFAAGVVTAFIVNLLQVKWRVTTKPLKPKFNKLNPINGFKRFISVNSLVNLIKSILILGALLWVVYSSIKDEIGVIFNFYRYSLIDVLGYIGNFVINTGIKISVVMLIIGFADYIYQRFKFNKDIMMTKQEVKDEYKNSEGDPKIKAQQRKRMMQASQRRMMQSVPEADVVITNPTHFAVAIKYDPVSDSKSNAKRNPSRAPVVLAKGEDYLAGKIKEIAKANNIAIVENKPLARMLYYNVDVGMEIPPELYQAVAEVLAFVYKMKNKQIYNAG